VAAFLFYSGSLLDAALTHSPIRDMMQGSSEHKMYRV